MAALSIVAGPPLADEEGLGTLTLGGWLREVTQAHAGREALVFHGPDGVVRWSHDDLWAQANAVARSLVACGVGKDCPSGYWVKTGIVSREYLGGYSLGSS